MDADGIVDGGSVGPLSCRSVETFQLAIYIAGDLERATQICRDWVDAHPRCVTFEPVRFIYTGGEETGVRVKLINYPRFPATPDELWLVARALGMQLLEKLEQRSFSIVATDRSEWYSRREEDLPRIETERRLTPM